MSPAPVDLSRKEQLIVSSVAIAWLAGELALRGVGNVTDTWWPLFGLLMCFVAFVVGFTVYLARSRKRSIRSVVSLQVPAWLRRRSS